MLALHSMWLVLHLPTSTKSFVTCLQDGHCLACVQVGNISASVFNTGQEEHSLPVIMKRLQNITIKRSRGTFNKLSIINKTKALIASKKKVKADETKTDAITPGGTTPDILPGADGKISLRRTPQPGTSAKLCRLS